MGDGEGRHVEGGGSGDGAPLGAGRRARAAGATLLTAVLFVQRILFGLMFTATGIWWHGRGDPGGYLAEQVADALSGDLPVGAYGAFLEGVVLPHAGVFARLVGTGELLSGLALLSGGPGRAGAAGAIFLLLNYTLAFGGFGLPPRGNFAIALVVTPLLTRWPYRWWSWSWPPRRGGGSGARRSHP